LISQRTVISNLSAAVRLPTSSLNDNVFENLLYIEVTLKLPK